MNTTIPPRSRRLIWQTADRMTNERLARRTAWVIIGLLAANQFMIGAMLPNQAAASPTAIIRSLFGVNAVSAYSIIGPQLNADGKTTSLVEQPTISQVPSNPRSGDDLADAKAVMLGTGSPTYAPDGISFSDPVDAQNKWGAYESLALTGETLSRYNTLADALLCSYCCGAPGDVTRNSNCGCAHAKAARGFFKYMLQTYSSKYSDEQLLGEAFRWQAIWYPKGAVEDYLLATGKVTVIGHQTHGGAGADGMHGLTK